MTEKIYNPIQQIQCGLTQQRSTIKDDIERDDDLDIDFDLDDDEEIDVNDTIFATLEDDDDYDDDDWDDDKDPNWNLITAFDEILEATRRRKGAVGHGMRGVSAMEYLMKQLQMKQMQVIVIAMLIDNGHAMTWKEMAHFLGISRLSMMTYTEEIEALVEERRWLQHTWAHRGCERNESFKLVFGVIKAIRHNEVFVPEDLSNLSEQNFAERLTEKIDEGIRNNESIFEDDEKWLMYLVDQNPQLPICKEVKSLNGDIHNKSLLLILVADYMRCGGQDNEGLTMHNIDSFFPQDWKCENLRGLLRNGSHELQCRGWVDFKCDDGIADANTFVLTQKAKDELLASVKPLTVTRGDGYKGTDRDLLHYKDIQSKELFYNGKESKAVERLRQILSQEQLPMIQQRLADKGMRTGIAVLLSGGPGTGKTETVRQLARQTGRDLLMIDISQVKDKFVGESEKNTKAIFERYKNLCKNAKVPPILFINECDAILGKRTENTDHSVDKMENSMQNILLQALEDLEGIIICTTNLAQNLDAAFERRFLMKVEFDKPGADVRAHIWQSMIPSLTKDAAYTLAERYSFSGGQCENVMRKATIEEIINGNAPTLELLDSFCKEENILQKNRLRPITGFAA